MVLNGLFDGTGTENYETVDGAQRDRAAKFVCV